MTIKRHLTVLALVGAMILSTFGISGVQANLNQTVTDGTPHQLSFEGWEPLNFNLNLITAGNGFSLALSDDGVLFAWGQNGDGQLGLGSGGTRTLPTPVPFPGDVRLVEVSAGESYAFALGEDGNIYAWGKNNTGQLGLGDTANRLTPTAIPLPAPGVTYTAISVGTFHTVALASDGSTYSWGSNNFGALGIGVNIGGDSSVPVKVHVPTGVTFAEVSVGSRFNLALGTDGKFYGWGSAAAGLLGNGSGTGRETQPVEVATPLGVTFIEVAAGLNSSLAIDTDGNLYSWGANLQGQLGLGGGGSQYTPTRVPMPPGVTLKGVAVGNNVAFATSTDGIVYSTGTNAQGQLGLGDKTNRNVFTSVVMPTGAAFGQVASGANHSLGLTMSGNLYSWGRGNNSALGTGDTFNRLTPTHVTEFNQ